MKTPLRSLALLAICLAAAQPAAHAAPPSLQPLLPGKWPKWPRGGDFQDVKVVGNYAYVALGAKFSIKEFHNVVLRGGSMPLAVLAQEVDSWVAAKKAGG